jgi:hypothetical protein
MPNGHFYLEYGGPTVCEVVIPCIRTSENAGRANFLELRHGEVRHSPGPDGPGPSGQGITLPYPGSCKWTSQNLLSTHSGE